RCRFRGCRRGTKGNPCIFLLIPMTGGGMRAAEVPRGCGAPKRGGLYFPVNSRNDDCRRDVMNGACRSLQIFALRPGNAPDCMTEACRSLLIPRLARSSPPSDIVLRETAPTA